MLHVKFIPTSCANHYKDLLVYYLPNIFDVPGLLHNISLPTIDANGLLEYISNQDFITCT